MDFAYVTKPDSTIDKNKPAKTKHDQKTESNNVKMQVANALQQNATFNEVIRKAYPSTIEPSKLAFNCIKQTAEALEEMDIDYNRCEDIAEIISQLMAKRLDGQNLTQHKYKYKYKYKYIIGSTEQFFSKDDFEAICNDEMFKNIREEQEKGKQKSNPVIDFETINMSKLRYNNFYSRSAMRDEVKRRQIEKGMPKAKGIGRPKSKYEVSLPSDEISRGHREYTLNHVTPVSEITSGHSSSEINTDEIQNEAWKSTNIVLGPDKNRRIYEPGNVKDIEADKICSFSKTKVKILDTQTNEMVEIKAESPVTAMRTDYVQFFYNECLKIFKKYEYLLTDVKKPKTNEYLLPDVEKLGELVCLAQVMHYRFKNIETRHAPLIGDLEVFINEMCDDKKQFKDKIQIVKDMIDKIIEYGKNEDDAKEIKQ